MRLKRLICLLGLMITTFASFAQMPETDIWLFELDLKNGGQLKKGVNITARKGYDNQPSFSADSKSLYYTSVQEASQSDVYACTLKSKKTKRLTVTPESEYSPCECFDRKSICTVTVLKDSTQVLQKLSGKTFSVNTPSLAGIDSVGYYTFLNKDTLLYYVLTKPHSLRVITVNGQHEHFIANHPTRGFKAVSRHEVIFGLKDSAATTFYLFDFRTKEAVKYAEHQGIHEDIFWHEKNGLFISDGVQLKRYLKNENNWQMIYDFSAYGLKKITRFCFSADGKYLAVVDNTD